MQPKHSVKTGTELYYHHAKISEYASVKFLISSQFLQRWKIKLASVLGGSDQNQVIFEAVLDAVVKFTGS